MKKTFSSVTLIGFSLSLLLSWGCASSPSPRFYTLSTLAAPPGAEAGKPLNAGLAVGLGPIQFPDYLDRPGIVTRTGGNIIEIAEFDLWAGSFKEAFTNTLARNLSILLNTEKILIYPFIGVFSIDRRILLSIEQFEGALAGEVFLSARWVVLEGPDKKEGLVRRSEIREPVSGSGYADLVAAQSRAVERLSREIALAIRDFPPPSAAK